MAARWAKRAKFDEPGFYLGGDRARFAQGNKPLAFSALHHEVPFVRVENFVCHALLLRLRQSLAAVATARLEGRQLCLSSVRSLTPTASTKRVGGTDRPSPKASASIAIPVPVRVVVGAAAAAIVAAP
jgi:hypothetical protein